MPRIYFQGCLRTICECHGDSYFYWCMHEREGENFPRNRANMYIFVGGISRLKGYSYGNSNEFVQVLKVFLLKPPSSYIFVVEKQQNM